MPPIIPTPHRWARRSLVAWLAGHDPLPEWGTAGVLRGPAIAKALGLLAAPSLIGE